MHFALSTSNPLLQAFPFTYLSASTNRSIHASIHLSCCGRNCGCINFGRTGHVRNMLIPIPCVQDGSESHDQCWLGREGRKRERTKGDGAAAAVAVARAFGHATFPPPAERVRSLSPCAKMGKSTAPTNWGNNLLHMPRCYQKIAVAFS